LSGDDYGPIAFDWAAYDARAIRYVHGIATQRHRIHDVSALREVERLPQFLQWVKRPVLGERVEITRDCLTMPWSAILTGASEAELDAAARTVRAYLQQRADLSIATHAVIAARAILTEATAAIDVRLRGIVSAARNGIWDGAKQAVFDPTRPLREVAKILDRGIRHAQLLGVGAKKMQTSLVPVTPKQALTVQAALAWGEYLGSPHPELGRKGAICPFIKQTIALGQFFVSVHQSVDGRSIRKLRRVVLDEARRYDELCPTDNKKAAFSGIVIVLPDCDPTCFATLDKVHAELKTHFMRHDLMFSAFHPNSRKPSIANASFHPFNAPFAAFVVRRVDVRDIAFLGHNRDAFERYYERFASLFRERKVSNEFSHARLFEQACERFGFASPQRASASGGARQYSNFSPFNAGVVDGDTR
jgi:hypothetical protein